MQFSDSFTFLKILNGIFLLISLYLAYYLFNKFSKSPKIAFLSTFFLLLNAHVLLYSTMIMSEISFILFSFLCLAFIINIDFKANIFKNPFTYLTLVTLVIAYYIRSSGLALFGGLVLYLMIKKQWRAIAFFTTGFFVLALPWIIRGRNLGGNSYIKPLVMINPYRPELGVADIADYFNRFFSNVSRYITREIPSSSLPFIKVNYLEPVTVSEWIVGFTILAIMAFGLFKLRKNGLIIFSYLLGTFGILLLWPEVWTGVRFILPIVPLLIFFLVLGVDSIISNISSFFKLNVKISILLLVIVGLAFSTSIKRLHIKSVNEYPAAWKNYFKVANWFKTEGQKDVVVICRKPMLFHLHSETYTSNFKYAQDTEEMIQDLEKRKADYVVLENLGYRQTYEYLLPAVNDHKEKFNVVLKINNPDTYLLKFYSEN